MAKEILNVEDLGSLRGKTVLLRLDVNTSVDPKTKKAMSSPRLEASARSIMAFAKAGAKVVACGHQGQSGKPDFISLKSHCAILSKLTGIKIMFADDPQVVSPKTIAAIKVLKQGEVMLLENLRFSPEEAVVKPAEEHAKGPLVSALAPVIQYYVNDAFSVAHRSHASIVGFALLMPGAMGPVFANEYENASKAQRKAARPVMYFLGGAKAEDYIPVMEHVLKNGIADKVYTSGIIGELCLLARGSPIPQATKDYLRQTKQYDLLTQVRELLSAYNEFIETPFDFAYEDEKGERVEIMLSQVNDATPAFGDIGTKTARKYSNAIMKAKTVFLKGPPGIYEKPAFQNGTKTMFTAMTNTKGFTLLGGGNSTDAFARFGIDEKKISFISLSGGALLEFMQGKVLPGIKALEVSAKKFGNKLK